MKRAITITITLCLILLSSALVSADFNQREDMNFQSLFKIKNATNITADDTLITNQICLVSDCRTTWPTGGSGGDGFWNITGSEWQINSSGILDWNDTKGDEQYVNEEDAYTLNLTGDTGTSAIFNNEILGFLGAGIINIVASGNTVTITGTETDPYWSGNESRVTELTSNVSQVNTTANIESLGFVQGAHTTQYILNVSGDSGSGAVFDSEVLDFNGAGTVTTAMVGNILTITGSAHSTPNNDSFNQTGADERYVNVVGDTMSGSLIAPGINITSSDNPSLYVIAGGVTNSAHIHLADSDSGKEWSFDAYPNGRLRVGEDGVLVCYWREGNYFCENNITASGFFANDWSNVTILQSQISDFNGSSFNYSDYFDQFLNTTSNVTFHNLTTTGIFKGEGLGTGNLVAGDFDARFGSFGTNGAVAVGGLEVAMSELTVGGMNLNGTAIWRNNGVGDSDTEFLWATTDNLIRLAIPMSGADFAMYNPRSFMVGGDLGQSFNDDIINCSAQGYTQIDCDTSGTGADLGVQDDLEVRGAIYANDWGDVTITESQVTDLSHPSYGWMNSSTEVSLVDASDNVSMGSFFVDNTANWIGLGTTTPTAAFHLNGTGSIRAKLETDTSQTVSTDFINALSYFNLGVGNSNIFRIRDTNNGSNPFTIENDAGEDVLYLQAGGNVGVGTPTPSYTLDVNGTVHVTNDVQLDANLDVDNLLSANSNFFAYDNFIHFSYGDTGNPAYKAYRANGDISTPTNVVTGNRLGMYKGFGYTGSWTLGAEMIYQVDGTVSAGVVPTAITWQTMNAAGSRTERMRVDPEGNLGIGTSAPERSLHVAGTGTQMLLLDSTDDGAVQIRMRTNGSKRFLSKDSDDATESQLIFNKDSILFAGATTPGDDALFINTTTGNVGIGTSTPGEVLDVIGRINASTDVCIDGGNCLSTRGEATGYPVYFTCGENAALDAASEEWSCGGNGETGQEVYLAENVTLTDVAMDCNVNTGDANVSIRKNLVETDCYLFHTNHHDSTNCNTDFDAGDWFQPYTVTDTGHSQCVVTMRFETR